MHKTQYYIPQMDCPSEENMIRIKLDGLPEIKEGGYRLEVESFPGAKETFDLAVKDVDEKENG